MTKRLVSGIQPTGELHLGNYLGALKQWVEYQEEFEAYYFIATYHALTGRPKPAELQTRILDTAALLVAVGVDPKTAVVFTQLPEQVELGWILSNFTSLGQLNRMTQFKEKSNQHGQNVGLYTYPILQAADIALYEASVVPVGEDQVQHLELAREIIRSFNNFLGQPVLVEPKPLLNNGARVMALNDPSKKMSKSLSGSAIGLLASEDEVARVIKRAVTDSDPNATEASPALKNLFVILETVSSPETYQHFAQLQKNGGLRYSELKEQLIEDVVRFLKPIQKTYHSLRGNEDQLTKILADGQARAETVARPTLAKVKKAIGLVN